MGPVWNEFLYHFWEETLRGTCPTKKSGIALALEKTLHLTQELRAPVLELHEIRMAFQRKAD